MVRPCIDRPSRGVYASTIESNCLIVMSPFAANNHNRSEITTLHSEMDPFPNVPAYQKAELNQFIDEQQLKDSTRYIMLE